MLCCHVGAAVQARLTLEPGSVEQVKRDYGPIMLHFVLPGKPSGDPDGPPHRLACLPRGFPCILQVADWCSV